MAYMRLGDLLVASGIITEAQLEQALAMPREDGQRLGDVLIQHGFITEAQLIDALRVQLGVDFIDLTAVSIPVELARYVPRNIAKKYGVVPVKLVQDRLYLAMHDPLDFVAQDEVKTASRKRVVPMIATRRAVEQAIALLYGSEGTARVIEEMKREAGSSEDIVPAQLPHDTADDIYRIRLTGTPAEPPRLPPLQDALAERFFALQLRDETTVRRDLWDKCGEDTLRGLFLQELRRQYDAAADDDTRRRIEQAVRFGTAAMDNREV